MKKCVPRACVYVDNMVIDDELEDEKTWNMKGSREFIERVGRDERVDAL